MGGQRVDEGNALSYPPIEGADVQPASVSAPSMATSPQYSQQPLSHDHQGQLTATVNSTASRKQRKGGNRRHIKSTVNIVAEPHHTKLGFFAGMTIAQIFRPGNGIDIDTFFGAKALYIAAHIPSPKRVEAMINEKHQAENSTDEDLVKEKLFDKRLAGALNHKFGPDNLQRSKDALKLAQKTDQARQNYIAMLVADDSSELNPISICTYAGCPAKHARAQASQSRSSASTPAASSSAIASATGVGPGPASMGETSSEEQMITSYAAAAETVGGASSRLHKRAHDTQGSDTSCETLSRAVSKRRKLSDENAAHREQQQGEFRAQPDRLTTLAASNHNNESSFVPNHHSEDQEEVAGIQSQHLLGNSHLDHAEGAESLSVHQGISAAVSHHSAPSTLAQPIDAASGMGVGIAEASKGPDHGQQDIEDTITQMGSGLYPSMEPPTSTTPYYHEGPAALNEFAQDVDSSLEFEQQDSFDAGKSGLTLGEEHLLGNNGTTTHQMVDSEGNRESYMRGNKFQLDPELDTLGHSEEGGDSITL
ncbi:hypothetical protein CB0940_03629 [Cercospora beticola]|uniref:Uncharacterized protein n=1 Tax=Cercospora beticola TaxID=122368 RepID=A0A2G5I5M5_CERBT|nr:hypothetical protein CB0940_03629 [Cercospora beticola]PIA99753.1 hypothetical protein CB0940_03629 [Cercospora beticola]WPB00809.1 hypothetical protein RHO25_005429 [Cercospora beticola]